jgi:hypothetical protein
MTGAVDNPYDTWCTGRPAGECYEGFHDATFSDGWWILLHPLLPGQHEIHFNGKVSAWGNFEVDIVYNLTVANRAP